MVKTVYTHTTSRKHPRLESPTGARHRMAQSRDRFSLDDESTDDPGMFVGKKLVIFVDLDTRPTLFTKKKSGICQEILGRQENDSIFLVVVGSEFPPAYKKGECFDNLNKNGRIKSYKAGSKANAADLRLIRLLVDTYLELPKDVAFTIVSGDMAFRAIVEEISERPLAVVSSHPRHDLSSAGMVNKMFREHVPPSDKSTRLDETIDKLRLVSCLSKVFFVKLTDQDMFEQHNEIVAQLTKEDARMLLFGAETSMNNIRQDGHWMQRFINNGQCSIIDTNDHNKDDAPVFMLVFFALVLHRELNDDSKAEFCIVTRAADTMPLNEIREGCKVGHAREVNIHHSFTVVEQ